MLLKESIPRFVICTIICFLNVIVIYVRLKRLTPVTSHKLQMIALVVSNIMCCLSIVAVTAFQLKLDPKADFESGSKISCSSNSTNGRLYNVSRSPGVDPYDYLHNMSNYMTRNRLCYLRVHPTFYMISLGDAKYLGNFISTPLIILNRLMRSYVIVLSVVKAVRVSFTINIRSASSESVWRDAAHHIGVVFVLSLGVCVLFYLPSYWRLDQRSNLIYSVTWISILLSVPFLLQFVAFVVAVVIMRNRDQDTDDSSSTCKTVITEENYQTISPPLSPFTSSVRFREDEATLSNLPTAISLNMVKEEERPLATRDKVVRKLEWSSLPRRLQEMVVTFLFICLFYICVHFLIGIIVSIFYEEWPFTGIRWIVFFVDMCVPVYCGEDFVLSLFVKNRRIEMVEELSRICGRAQ